MDKETIRRSRAALKLWGDADGLITYHWQMMRDARSALEEFAPAYRALVIDGMPHGSDKSSPTEQAVISIEDFERRTAETIQRCQASINRLMAYKRAVNQLVSTLPTVERDLIVRVYRDHMSILTASTLSGVSERTGYNRESSAINRIGRRLLAWDMIDETA